MLMNTRNFRHKLEEGISRAKTSVYICSACIKKSALERICESMSQEVKDVRVVARWQLADILSKSSDLGVYELCRTNGWQFGIDLDFHGKLYCIDKQTFFLGSANITNKGLELTAGANKEIGVNISAEQVDLDLLSSFFKKEVIWLDDKLFQEITDHVSSIGPTQVAEKHSWPAHITEKVTSNVNTLWISDLIEATPEQLQDSSETSLNDQAILSLPKSTPLPNESLKNSFRHTRLYLWITALLKVENSISIGGIRQALHNSLLDEKRISRREVSTYVTTLCSWLEFMNEDFSVKQPNWTKIYSLKEQNL